MPEEGKEVQGGFQSKEEVALSKLRDINAPGTIAYTTSIEKLSAILKDGLISENLAKKAGRNFKSNWAEHSDPNSVYIAELSAGGENQLKSLHDLAVLISVWDLSRVAVLILDKSILKEAKPSSWPSERVIKHRFSSRYIVGIAVGGTMEGSMDYYPDRSKVTTFTGDKDLLDSLKNKALVDMEEVFGSDNGKFVPIYDTDGNLLWPKGMTRDQVRHIGLGHHQR